MKLYKQKGSSLIEVMISLFVLAIGLLGILGMQVKSMKFNQSADTYGRAIVLANDIAERIRGNPKNATAYASTAIPATAPTSCSTSAFDTPACSPADLVNWDLFNWSNAVQKSLPAGSGEISLKTQGTQSYIQIIVSFDDSRATDDSTPSKKQYTLLVEHPTQLGGA
ncbi:type IV pilus modification protein PilV [Saccharophagus sp. K07]|uniref:type IV pilus modification protein PilV n=1 Tax=Saccharophagus sp. K07 TaxID=2283636 RepID=UPI0016524324|nr:type IV pilus modification protein PilV [Saccharophagus sp. K07]